MRIGNKELEILTFIAENGSVTVRDTASHFGAKSGLVRTTVLRMMDRLLAKGFLGRGEENGVFRYWSLLKLDQVKEHLTEQFVTETLSGSIAPFVAYLSGGAAISPTDLEELKSLVKKLEEEAR